MTPCDPNDAIPKTCADAFQNIAVGLAKMDQKLDDVVVQTTKTNGSVAALQTRVEAVASAHALLAAVVATQATTKVVWADRLWKLAVAVGLLVAGYALAALK